VTNIDADHLDYYKDLDEIKETFVSFINKVPFFGLAVLCLDDANLQGLIPRVNKRFITYGLEAQADLHATDIEYSAICTSFMVHFRGKQLGMLSFQMPGRHNVLNALAAVAVGLELEIPFAQIVEGMKDFGGVQRRFQIKGEPQGIMVVDDYGHHPAEIKATLAAARAGWKRRVVAVFQPHRYSRTQALFDDFVTAFYQADYLILTDIYAAGEEPIAGISAQELAAKVAGHGHKEVHYVADVAKVAEHLQGVVREGDMVITLGAGNIWQAGEELIKRLSADG
jgi:UDP-N-acetylmuramate--alanine ligase